MANETPKRVQVRLVTLERIYELMQRVDTLPAALSLMKDVLDLDRRKEVSDMMKLLYDALNRGKGMSTEERANLLDEYAAWSAELL